MGKFIRWAFLLLIIVGIMGTGQVWAQRISIAIVPKALDNPVFAPTKVSAEKTAKELGVEFIWTASLQSDAASQAEVIRELIRRKVDAIGISVNDAAVLTPVINEAIAAGIAVSTWDSDAADSNRFFYVGTDNYAGGLECGRLMASLLKGKGKVTVLEGVPGAPNLNERIRGFQDGIKDSGVEIYATIPCYDQVDKSAQEIESFTRRNKRNFDGWWFVGGWPLFAPLKQMPSLKTFKGKVVSFDYFTPAYDFVKQGVVDVCVAQDFHKMGELSVRYLYDTVVRGVKPPDFVDSGIQIVTLENLDEVQRSLKGR